MGHRGELPPFFGRRLTGRLVSPGKVQAEVAGRLESLVGQLNLKPDQWIWLRIARRWHVSPSVVQREWTLYEVLDAHEVLDLEEAAQIIAGQVQEEQARRKR